MFPAATPQPVARPSPTSGSNGEPTAIQSPLDIRNAALSTIAVLAVVAMLQYAQAVIIPIVLGVLISYALEPPVIWLTRLRVPRAAAAAIVLTVVVGVLGVLVYGLRSEGSAILGELPQAARRFRETMEREPSSTASSMQQVQKAATELEKAATAAAPPPEPVNAQRVVVEQPLFNVGDYVLWGSMGVATAVGQSVLIVFFVFFVLASGDLYRRKLVKIAGPSFTKKKITLQILEEIDRQIEMFLLVEVATSALVAVATWLAFRWLGLEQAAVWGVAAGVFNSILYFGPVIVMAGTAVVAFLQFGSVEMTLLVSGVSLAITTLEGLLLTPWLTSRAARMNAVAIFCGLLFWGWIWNVWGMLLAVPILVALKSVCDRVEGLQSIGELLGD